MYCGPIHNLTTGFKAGQLTSKSVDQIYNQIDLLNCFKTNTSVGALAMSKNMTDRLIVSMYVL